MNNEELQYLYPSFQQHSAASELQGGPVVTGLQGGPVMTEW
jgi:hypothetical protein